ncbi:MAG: thiamine-phosphate kinase [Desulfuromonadales bacterium]
MTSPANTNLSTLGEFGLISRIASASKQGAGVITGIGDDAAITALTPGMQLLTSTDMLLEDVHFRRAWHDPYRLGRKSLAVNISDIAAMGGIPRWALLSLAIPAGLPLDFLDDFVRGFLTMSEEHGVSLVGGDTCASRSGVVISVTIMGEQFPERILRRSGARPGDDIWVTGTLGDAALGLKLLEKQLPLPEGEGRGEGERNFLISRLLDPTPRAAAGLALAESALVTAMIDISDGLLSDFGHIAGQSHVGGLIRIAELPLSAPFRACSVHFPELRYDSALTGGEDYELCFTASPANRKIISDCMKKCGIEATAVGIVTSLSGVRAVHEDGSPYHTKMNGFKHF